MSHRLTLDFLLNDWLQAESLCQREFHAEHSRDTFDAVLDLSDQIAPINRLTDIQEPEYDALEARLDIVFY